MPETGPHVDAPSATPAGAGKTRRQAVAALRAQLAGLTAPARAEGPRIGLGHADFDADLPQGGLPSGAVHAVQPGAHGDQPAALGFAAALAARALAVLPGALIWVRAPAVFDFGAPYAPGLAGFGLDPARLVQVRARTNQDALWAAEEALRCRGAGAVVLEAGRGFAGACARRLQLAAEAGGGFGVILGAAETARSHWLVQAAPSAAPAWSRGQGLPAILIPPGRVALRVRRRMAQSRERDFLMEWCDAARGFHPLAVLADGSLAAAA
jgi:protein ImuA